MPTPPDPIAEMMDQLIAAVATWRQRDPLHLRGDLRRVSLGSLGQGTQRWAWRVEVFHCKEAEEGGEIETRIFRSLNEVSIEKVFAGAFADIESSLRVDAVQSERRAEELRRRAAELPTKKGAPSITPPRRARLTQEKDG